MKFLVKSLICAVAGAVIIAAQSVPAFEVASVKPHKAGDRRLGFPDLSARGTFTETGIPLPTIIALAYNLPYQSTQVSGGPDWIRSPEGVYDIEAKVDPAAMKGLSPQARTDKMRLMLQALLAYRFKLVIRRESKVQPVYILTVAKNGPRLQKSKIQETDCSDDSAAVCHAGNGGQGRGIHAKGFDMADLAAFVSNYTERPVLDRTGLTGLYDIDTDGWVPMRTRAVPPGAETNAESASLSDPERPTLFMIFERLGLKMEASKAPVDMFVIEHVERPIAN